MQPFAAFDIDGTLFRLALFTHVFEAMVTHGSVSPETLVKVRKAEALRRTRKTTYDEYMNTVIHALDHWLLQRHPKDLLETLAHESLAHRVEEVYVFTRSLLQSVQELTYATLAVSYTPVESARAFCTHWGFTHFDASIQEVCDEGRYTGKRQLRAKDETLREIIRTHGYDLEGSIGVGDTGSDIPMIAMTQFPVAFNPSAELLRQVIALPHCLVVQERKNVCTIMGFEYGKQVPLNQEWRSPNGTPHLPDAVVPRLTAHIVEVDYTLLIL